MANNIKYPEAGYKIVKVGPTRDWSFKGDNGEDIAMRSYSLQLEGVAEWIDVAQKPDTAAPVEGETVEGHIEDTGKYGFKFVKKRKGGWGGKSNAGAHFNSAVQMASDIVIGYYQVKGEKPKNIDEVLTRIEQLAPKVKVMVDKFAGTEKKEEAPAAEAKPAESSATDPIVIEDVDEKELSW